MDEKQLYQLFFIESGTCKVPDKMLFSVGKKMENIRPLVEKELVFEDELFQKFNKEEVYRKFNLL